MPRTRHTLSAYIEAVHRASNARAKDRARQELQRLVRDMILLRVFELHQAGPYALAADELAAIIEAEIHKPAT
jgi:hypothetical protein